jgi:glycosyltransferase involved in cell wall biosynthesis
MKICVAADSLPGYHKIWAGAEQATERIARLLTENGQEVVFLTSTPDFKLSGENKLEGVAVLDNFLGRKFKNLMIKLFPFDVVAGWSSYRALKKIKPEVVSVHNHSRLTFSLIWSAKRLKLPVIFSVYDHWSLCPNGTLINEKGEQCQVFQGGVCARCLQRQGRFYALLAKLGLLTLFFSLRRKIADYFLRRIDAFIVLSNTWAEILKKYGIKEKSIFVVPLPLFKVPEIKEVAVKPNSILFVGWVNPHKGLQVLIEALPEVLATNSAVHLYVVESGEKKEYKAKLLDFVKKYRLENQVSFLGKKTNLEVRELLQKVELVVVPEQWGIAWPIFLTEAMAFAKPLIASKIGDIPEFIQDGRTGLLADHRQVQDFARKIIWMLKNKEQAQAMGKAARAKILEICNETTIYEKILAVCRNFKGGR